MATKKNICGRLARRRMLLFAQVKPSAVQGKIKTSKGPKTVGHKWRESQRPAAFDPLPLKPQSVRDDFTHERAPVISEDHISLTHANTHKCTNDDIMHKCIPAFISRTQERRTDSLREEQVGAGGKILGLENPTVEWLFGDFVVLPWQAGCGTPEGEIDSGEDYQR